MNRLPVDRDEGRLPGSHVAGLREENREIRQANQILRKTSGCFDTQSPNDKHSAAGQGKFDCPFKR
ncbi:hypothetical protein [Aureimonas ureilytica]|uniref:hypothetical protein n=1 Tax=Aureimonas ureilytica TaxID=401562 RepID=UPI000AF0FE65